MEAEQEVGRASPRAPRPPLGDRSLLLLLLAADAVYIGAHFVHALTRHLADPRYALAFDRGYGEFFQYLQELWAVLLLCSLALRRASAVYAAWGLLFMYLMVDDFFLLHEWLGFNLSHGWRMTSMLGLRGQDIAELAVVGSVGAVLLLVIAAAHLRAGPSDRAFSRRMGRLLAGLLVFGVVCDMLHEMLRHTALDITAEAVEDGGEMIVMSLAVAFLFRVHARARGV